MIHEKIFIPNLHGLVHTIIFMEKHGNKENHIIQKLLPNPYHGLVLNFGENISIVSGDGNTGELPSSYFALAAKSKEYVILKFPGGIKSVIITFPPQVPGKIFNFHPGSDKRIFVDTREIPGQDIGMLYKQIEAAECQEDILKVIEEYFKERIAKSDMKENLLDLSVEKILNSSGCIRIDDLANQCMVSKRTLERHFARYLGTTPLQYARIVRCHSVIKNLLKGNLESAYDVIEHYNYYDPSHFSHDFRKFTGESPRFYQNNGHLLERIISAE